MVTRYSMYNIKISLLSASTATYKCRLGLMATLIILPPPRDEILPKAKRKTINSFQRTNIICVPRMHSQHVFYYMKKIENKTDCLIQRHLF